MRLCWFRTWPRRAALAFACTLLPNLDAKLPARVWMQQTVPFDNSRRTITTFPARTCALCCDWQLRLHAEATATIRCFRIGRETSRWDDGLVARVTQHGRQERLVRTFLCPLRGEACGQQWRQRSDSCGNRKARSSRRRSRDGVGFWCTPCGVFQQRASNPLQSPQEAWGSSWLGGVKRPMEASPGAVERSPLQHLGWTPPHTLLRDG